MAKHNARAIAKLQASIEAQSAHVVRMAAAGQPAAAVRSARLILLTLHDELAHMQAGGTAATFDVFANAAARRQAVR
jgi:hypothetical protein